MILSLGLIICSTLVNILWALEKILYPQLLGELYHNLINTSCLIVLTKFFFKFILVAWLVVLVIIDRRIPKSPTVIIDLFFSFFNFVKFSSFTLLFSFRFLHNKTCFFLINSLFYHYKMPLLVLDNILCFEVSFVWY